jgi:ribosomal protein S18 acetylase RimI-like enzyme
MLGRSMHAQVLALRRIIRRQRLITYEMHLSGEAVAEAVPPPGVLIRRVRRTDSSGLAPLIVGRSLEERLAQGQLDGRPAGCIWFSRGPVDLARQLSARPGPHEVYSYGLRVLPELRRRGIARALVQRRSVEAARLGATVCFSHVDAWNLPAVAVQRALGATVREEAFGLLLLDRFAVTLWRRRPSQRR